MVYTKKPTLKCFDYVLRVVSDRPPYVIDKQDYDYHKIVNYFHREDPSMKL